MADKEEDKQRLGLGPAGFEGISVGLGPRLTRLSDKNLEQLTDGAEVGSPEITPVYDVLSPLREFGTIALPSEYVESFRDRIEVPEGKTLMDCVPPVPASYLFERAKGKATLERSIAFGVGKTPPPVEIDGILVHMSVDDDQEFLEAESEAIYDIGYITVGDNTYALVSLQVDPSAKLVEPVYLHQLGNTLRDLPGNAPHRVNLDLCFEFSPEDLTRSINGVMVYLAMSDAIEDGSLPENMDLAVVTNKAGYVGPDRSNVNVEFALSHIGGRTYGLFKPKSGFQRAFKEFTKGTYSGEVKSLRDIATGK